MKYTVYILWSKLHDKFYIGQTNDLDRRLEEHNKGKKGYTKRHVPWILGYFEEHSTRALAMKQEKYLKSFKNQVTLKKYIESKNIAGWRSGTSRGS